MEASPDTAEGRSHSRSAQDDAQVEAFLVAWFAVRRQVQALNFNRFNRDGLSATQFITLNLLGDVGEGQPVTIGGLAGRMNADPATAVRTVDSLEKRGLVRRRRDNQDRRQVFVELTEEGRAVHDTSRRGFRDAVAEVFRSMSEEGRVRLVEGLSEFVARGEPVVEGRATSPDRKEEHR